MRPITTLFMALLATFIMTACTQEKPPAQEPAQTAPGANIPAIDAAQQAAEEAKQRVEETAAVAKTETEKSAEAVKEHAAAVTEQAAAVTEQAAVVKEQAAEVKEQAAEVKEQAAAAVAAVAPAAKGPKVVSYEGSMGKVTFDHAGHAENMACSKCHPTEPAVTIVMNKEVGHTLCKNCHQSSGGNAPTACAGCHVK